MATKERLRFQDKSKLFVVIIRNMEKQQPGRVYHPETFVGPGLARDKAEATEVLRHFLPETIEVYPPCGHEDERWVGTPDDFDEWMEEQGEQFECPECGWDGDAFTLDQLTIVSSFKVDEDNEEL